MLTSPLCILSPHRDDAAFSCGALLALAAAAHLRVSIINVFTRSAYAPFAEDGLLEDGVTSLRLAEDQAVVALLDSDAGLVDLGMLDAPLRLRIRIDEVVSGPLDDAAMAEQVHLTRAALPKLDAARVVLLPLALGGHVDHIIVRDAALGALRPECLGFYQDLPYASRAASADDLATETAAIVEAASLITGTSFIPLLLHTDRRAVAKERLLACYPSQVAAETADEMSRWTAALGGELLYLSPPALASLRSMLPAAELTP